MDTTRLDDMLERYGECCHQKKAAHILGVTPRTIFRMLEDGRLRRVGMSVDVRSICAYIENPAEYNQVARQQKNRTSQRNRISLGDSCAPLGLRKEPPRLEIYAGNATLTLRLFCRRLVTCGYPEEMKIGAPSRASPLF